MISCVGLSALRGGRRIIGPVDLEIGGQGITALMGPNGAGKSTFLKLLHGIETPSAGEVLFAHSAAQAFVFQRPILLRRSVRANLALPLELAGGDLSRIEDIAEALDLTRFLQTSALSLSGGEAQRLALARALVAAPDVLFLDEPTANLDLDYTAQIEALLARCAEEGMRIILATHSIGQAKRLSQDLLWIEGGRVHGPFETPRFFEAPPDAARKYLESQL